MVLKISSNVEMTKYKILNFNLFSKNFAIKIKIGNETKMYLGILEKVPVSVGIKKVASAKNKSDFLTYLYESSKIIKPKVLTINSCT